MLDRTFVVTLLDAQVAIEALNVRYLQLLVSSCHWIVYKDYILVGCASLFFIVEFVEGLTYFILQKL